MNCLPCYRRLLPTAPVASGVCWAVTPMAWGGAKFQQHVSRGCFVRLAPTGKGLGVRGGGMQPRLGESMAERGARSAAGNRAGGCCGGDHHVQQCPTMCCTAVCSAESKKSAAHSSSSNFGPKQLISRLPLGLGGVARGHSRVDCPVETLKSGGEGCA